MSFLWSYPRKQKKLHCLFHPRSCTNFCKISLDGYKFCSTYCSSFPLQRVPNNNILLYLPTCVLNLQRLRKSYFHWPTRVKKQSFTHQPQTWWASGFSIKTIAVAPPKLESLSTGNQSRTICSKIFVWKYVADVTKS